MLKEQIQVNEIQKSVVVWGLEQSGEERNGAGDRRYQGEIVRTTLLPKVKRMLEKMGCGDVMLDDVYRMRTKATGVQPVKIKFLTHLGKGQVMEKSRALIGEKIFINEDRTKKQREGSKIIQGHIAELKNIDKDFKFSTRGTSLWVKKNGQVLSKYELKGNEVVLLPA